MTKLNWMFRGAGTLTAVLVAGYGAMNAQDSHAGAAASTLASEAAPASLAHDAPLVTLYKNPTCSCCAHWGEHMEVNGFRVEVKEGADLAQVKQELGIPFSAASCHTAEVNGYVLEGHVPADLVKKLLAERPDIAGLAVPGMPRGVPGMPGEGLGSYDVLAVDENGATSVYASK